MRVVPNQEIRMITSYAKLNKQKFSKNQGRTDLMQDLSQGPFVV
jgi:hypothetical protein